jgi:hypothetical protein
VLKRTLPRLALTVPGLLFLTVLLVMNLGAVRAAQLPQEDLTLTYRVYVLGLPTWFDATVTVRFEGERVFMNSELNSLMFSNSHQTEFTLADCRYRPVGYHNQGFSPGWRFDDKLQYDWENNVARYQGNLQRPSETEAKYQEIEHPLNDPESVGHYVDKLSQFLVIGCYLELQSGDAPLLVNYLDDTVGRYRMTLIPGNQKIKVSGTAYATIRLESEPYEATPGSIHQRVNYWLAPELGYLPLQVKTKLGRLPLTVRLTGFSRAGDGSSGSVFAD